jgi:hypothetical protein
MGPGAYEREVCQCHHFRHHSYYTYDEGALMLQPELLGHYYLNYVEMVLHLLASVRCLSGFVDVWKKLGMALSEGEVRMRSVHDRPCLS